MDFRRKFFTEHWFKYQVRTLNTIIWRRSINIIWEADPLQVDFNLILFFFIYGTLFHLFMEIYFILWNYYTFIGKLKLLKETEMNSWIKL